MIERVLSGGQTGADQAALRAARAAGISTGGIAALGWMVESSNGRTNIPAPWLSEYGLVECQEPGYPARAIANVQAADATLWFVSTDSPGARMILGTLSSHGKTSFVILQGTRPSSVVDFLRGHPWIKVLNIAGNREHRAPRIGVRTERFLLEVFHHIQKFEGQSLFTPVASMIGQPW